MQNPDVRLVAYGGASVQIIGKVDVIVSCNKHVISADVFIVKEGTYSLCGCDLLSRIRLISLLFSVSFIVLHMHRLMLSNLSLICLLMSSAVFLIVMLKFTFVKMQFQSVCHPGPYCTQFVPRLIKSLIGSSERVLLRGSILLSGLPLLSLSGKNGDIRLCADFKVTINKFIDRQQHPIPNPTDLLSSLAGEKVFSKLELRQAYAQVPLDEESMRYCVISTHRGLYDYTRLPYGVSSAPSIWQRVIEQIVQGIEGCTFMICQYLGILMLCMIGKCLKSSLGFGNMVSTLA